MSLTDFRTSEQPPPHGPMADLLTNGYQSIWMPYDAAIFFLSSSLSWLHASWSQQTLASHKEFTLMGLRKLIN